MGNPTTPVLSVVPEPPKYNVYDLVSLAFRLARKAVSHENYKIYDNFFENFQGETKIFRSSVYQKYAKWLAG